MRVIMLLLGVIVSLSVFGQETNPTSKVYPLIKGHDWSAKNHALHTPFLGLKDDKMPVVAYVYDKENNYQFITKYDNIENPESLHDEALKNLCARKVNIEKISSNSVTASGDDFSSEMVLCNDFIQSIQGILKTDRIWVFIPRRTILYIAAADMPAEERNKFFYLSMYTYGDDSYGHTPISDTFFEMENGNVVSVFLLSKK